MLLSNRISVIKLIVKSFRCRLKRIVNVDRTIRPIVSFRQIASTNSILPTTPLLNSGRIFSLPFLLFFLAFFHSKPLNSSSPPFTITVNMRESVDYYRSIANDSLCNPWRQMLNLHRLVSFDLALNCLQCSSDIITRNIQRGPAVDYGS